MESGFSRYFDGKRKVFGLSRISKTQKSPTDLVQSQVVSGQWRSLVVRQEWRSEDLHVGHKELGVGVGRNIREEILADIHPVRENHSEKAKEEELL